LLATILGVVTSLSFTGKDVTTLSAPEVEGQTVRV
jgi:hypothetical protein